VIGRDLASGRGEMDITAWDTTHMAGTFAFTGNNKKKYAGTFDIKCPHAGNGVCTP